MKRLALLTVLAVSIMALMSWVNCSNPLEAEGDNPERIIERLDTLFDTVFDTIFPPNPDTMWIYDTIHDTISPPCPDTLWITDTLTDTLWKTDTLYITDTLTDTLYITDTLTDTLYVCEVYSVCSPIYKNLYEIFWTFDNPAGDYVLYFTAEVERQFEKRTLILDIDGNLHEWKPTDSLYFTVTEYLSEGATIHIKTDTPHLLGHRVDICLGMSKR